MAHRPVIAETIEELAKLPLEQINAEIQKCLHYYNAGGLSQARKAFFKRLVWLEEGREELHKIPAPTRRYNK